MPVPDMGSAKPQSASLAPAPRKHCSASACGAARAYAAKPSVSNTTSSSAARHDGGDSAHALSSSAESATYASPRWPTMALSRSTRDHTSSWLTGSVTTPRFTGEK